jgi:hypothetical protein
MARPDGRIEKGQRLSSAISARAWNRAQEAADRVLGAGTGVEAGGQTIRSLPSLRTQIGVSGFYGQAVSPGVGVGGTLLSSTAMPPTATSMQSFSAIEKVFPQFNRVRGIPGNTSVDDENKFFICCGNNEDLWVWSGYAITRVRVYNYFHRFAFKEAGVSSGYEHCLSSSFYGPARVLGYFKNNISTTGAAGDFVGSGELTFTTTAQLVHPNSEMRWALVVF